MEGHGLSVQHLAGKDATVGNAIKEMPSCQWVHLACHATQNPLRPLKSAFHLLNDQLSLSEIIKLKIPDADLAFLSACQTSTGDKQLSDEAVHLAAGMLAAGYRSVVSTMWSIGDSYGADVAESFYSHLLNRAGEEGKPWPDSKGAAHAIHYATQCLRKRLGDTERSLLMWVPYVHFGI
jgi:CHAT domain-containing protein